MHDLNNTPMANHKFSKSLKAYFHDEFRNGSVLPYSIPSKTIPEDIIFAYNGDYALINSRYGVD